jgi:hypothetical protein
MKYFKEFLLNVKLFIDLMYSITRLSILLFLIYFSYNSYQKIIQVKNSIIIELQQVKNDYLKHIENEKQQFNKLYDTIEKQQNFINKQVNQQEFTIDGSKLIMNIISDFILPSSLRRFLKK